jgi:hypothetical protein
VLTLGEVQGVDRARLLVATVREPTCLSFGPLDTMFDASGAGRDSAIGI